MRTAKGITAAAPNLTYRIRYAATIKRLIGLHCGRNSECNRHYGLKFVEIGNIVNNNEDAKLAAAKLLQLANELDGGDNISVQLVRIRNVERMGMYRGRPYKLR